MSQGLRLRTLGAYSAQSAMIVCACFRCKCSPLLGLESCHCLPMHVLGFVMACVCACVSYEIIRTFLSSGFVQRIRQDKLLHVSLPRQDFGPQRMKGL